MVKKYTLNYFPRMGRAECARLMFHAAGVEFTDNQIPFEEWPKHKGDAKRFPIHQMPTLQVDGVTITQSYAIYYYLGNEFNMCGTTIMEKAVVDQLMESVRVIFDSFSHIMFDQTKDDAEKQIAYAEVFGSTHKDTMNFLSNQLNSHTGPFFTGDKLSMVDCFYFTIHEYIVGTCPAVMDAYPAMVSLHASIAQQEAIKTYLSSRTQSP